MVIYARDLTIGAIFWFDDREHRVTDIIQGPIVEVITRRSSVLGDYEVTFNFRPETELMTEPTGTPNPLD